MNQIAILLAATLVGASPNAMPSGGATALPVQGTEAAEVSTVETARVALEMVSDADWARQRTGPLLNQVFNRTSPASVEALARTGDARAQALIGYAYYFGGGSDPVRRHQGRDWLEQATRQGDLNKAAELRYGTR